MDKKVVNAGLLGAGTIGKGVVDLYLRNSDLINSRIDFNLVIKKVADLDWGKLNQLGLDREMLVDDAGEILGDPGIDIVVELVGGLRPAYGFVKKALENGKHVVTANKDLLATHGEELLGLARKKKVSIMYEASVGGGIPLIRPLKASLVADRVRRLVGIVNGTTNYIFTRMDCDDLSLHQALEEAKRLGFAEPDPTNDLEGLDAAYKLVIMAKLAFGKKAALDQVYIEGIGGITHEDIVYAREIGYTIKLLAIGEELPGGLALRVHPALVSLKHPLASVQNELNAVFIESEAARELMFYGPGAGPLPTATAILADVVEAGRIVISGRPGGPVEMSLEEAPCIEVEKLEARFYLRFLVEDRAGVFASLATAFADENVSIDMIIQKRRFEGNAEVVLVTHETREDAFNRALERVKCIATIKPNPSIIRVLPG